MYFRSSHYFVSYLSELTALAAGIDTSTTERWTVTVTRPWHIELPRSLVEVVIHWNVPMHTWLKTCKLYLLHLVSWKLRRINIDHVFNVIHILGRCFSRRSAVWNIFRHHRNLWLECSAPWIELPVSSRTFVPWILYVHRACHAPKTCYSFQRMHSISQMWFKLWTSMERKSLGCKSLQF